MDIPRDLNEYLAQFSPDIMEIAVVTDAEGSGATAYKDAIYWTVSIDIIAWKDLSSGDIHIEKLRLSDMVKDYSILRQKLKADSIVALKAQKGGLGVLHGFHIVELLDCDKHPDLEKILEESKQPAYYIDKALGKFTLNRASNSFERRIRWAGHNARLSFSNDTKEKTRLAVETAKVLKERQTEWDDRIRQFAARKLIGLKNDIWLEEDDPELTEADFAGKLRISEIFIKNDGKFEFWYKDGGMFEGHEVLVAGSVKKGPESAEMQ